MGLVTCIEAQAEVVESIAWRSYPVLFPEGVSMRAALKAASPVRQNAQVFHAYTRWNVRWDLRWHEERQGRCTLTAVRTTLEGEVLLPEVRAESKVWPAWLAYLQALRVHELAHLERGRAAAHLIDRRIATLPPASSCTVLGAQANQAGREVLETARRDELAYDRDTGYGRTQGARLP